LLPSCLLLILYLEPLTKRFRLSVRYGVGYQNYQVFDHSIGIVYHEIIVIYYSCFFIWKPRKRALACRRLVVFLPVRFRFFYSQFLCFVGKSTCTYPWRISSFSIRSAVLGIGQIDDQRFAAYLGSFLDTYDYMATDSGDIEWERYVESAIVDFQEKVAEVNGVGCTDYIGWSEKQLNKQSTKCHKMLQVRLDEKCQE
jgi:hypothetical protein